MVFITWPPSAEFASLEAHYTAVGYNLRKFI